MKTVFLNVNDETVSVIDVEHSLQAWYDKIGCSLVDIVTRKVGGEWYEIVCDEEGLLQNEPKISAIDGDGSAMLVGNLLFFKDGGNGELRGLKDKEIRHLLGFIMYTFNHLDGYPMVTECEYF